VGLVPGRAVETGEGKGASNPGPRSVGGAPRSLAGKAACRCPLTYSDGVRVRSGVSSVRVKVSGVSTRQGRRDERG